MSVLPEHPDLQQARRQAKELLQAGRTGEAAALARLAAVWAPLTLTGAQLTLARELGQPSWAALVREIEARNTSIPEDVTRFLRSSVNLQIGAAARMLYENPGLAASGFPAAVVLGDRSRVEAGLRRDPGVASARITPLSRTCRRLGGRGVITFRQLGETDLELLHGWLNQPHVSEWWGGPQALQKVRSDYLEPAPTDRTTYCVADCDGNRQT